MTALRERKRSTLLSGFQINTLGSTQNETGSSGERPAVSDDDSEVFRLHGHVVIKVQNELNECFIFDARGRTLSAGGAPRTPLTSGRLLPDVTEVSDLLG